MYREKRILLIGEDDVVFLCPRTYEISLDSGVRVSLFPLAEIGGCGSEGLRWPIDGLEFSPLGQIGTSNRANGGPVRLWFDREAMLLILPLAEMENAFRSLGG